MILSKYELMFNDKENACHYVVMSVMIRISFVVFLADLQNE